MVESLVNEEKQERLIEKKDSDSKQEKKEIHEEKKVMGKEDCMKN